MASFLEQTAKEGAQLTIFPECAVTGYCFESLEEARPHAQPIPGPACEAMSRVCGKLGTYVIFGMLELAGDQIYNAAVLVGPQGIVGSYRKIHLPYLGIDMFTTYGNRPFAVHSAGDLRVGMNICYDASFPESARSLMLLGADLIALPTNWPPGSECVAQCAIRCRALENGVYFMAVNRVGVERGFEFIGQSQMADPSGKLLYCASSDAEEVFYADLDLERARRKHVIRVPGKHEINRLADRRPHLYGSLVQPHQLSSPGRGADSFQP
jgi:predicted amidohydrolase